MASSSALATIIIVINIIIIVVILQICPAFGYKILVYSPTLSPSHMISCARVADTLARDGHDVTLLEVEFNVPVGLNFSKNARTLGVSGGGPFFQFEMDGMDFQQMLAQRAFAPPSVIGSYKCYKQFQIALNNACERFVTSQWQIISTLKADNFDVIIEEQLNFCGAGLGHLLGIPTYILISSCPIQEHVASLLGLPFPSSYVPSIVDSNRSDKMSIFERFDNILRIFVGYTYIWSGIDPLTTMFRKHFGNDFPDISHIVKQTPFVFINVDELVDFPRPIFSNMVYIGGLGREKARFNTTLKEPFKTEIAKGRDGVILVSMGSIIRSSDLSERFRENLLETFGQFGNYHFIMRVETEDNFTAKVAKKFGNIMLTPWAPQTDLLEHPRLKLFISHGGYNSLLEAARSGVPLISMGFFADQYRNGRVAERNGWALLFEKIFLLEGTKEFREAISEVVDNPKYAIAAKRIQNLIKTKPFSAEERLTKSVRFLEQNDGIMPELLSESRNMSTIALYNLDLALIGVILVVISLLGMYFLAKWLLKKWFAWKKTLSGNGTNETRPKAD